MEACKDEIIKAIENGSLSISLSLTPEACTGDIKEAIHDGRIKSRSDGILDIHQKALDDLVNVNSLFTIAVFVGLAFAAPGQRSLENREECDADANLAKRLIVYEVISFGCFLLSSLVAKSLKFHIQVHKRAYFNNPKYWCFKEVTLRVSIGASVSGCLFLMLSMIDVLQIRLGKLTCGTIYTLSAAVCLIVTVSIALGFYFSLTMWAISRSMRKLKKYAPKAGLKRPQTGSKQCENNI